MASKGEAKKRKGVRDLSHQAGYYSALLSSLADAVFVSSGKITWCNERVKEIFGYASEEMVGKDAASFLPDDTDASAWTNSVYAATEKHKTLRGTTKVRKKDGSLADIEFTTTRVGGIEPPEFITVARDVSAREAANEALRRSEAYFKAVADHILDVLLVLNPDATIRYKTPTFDRMVGKSRSGRNPFDFVHPDDIASATETFSQLLEDPGSTIYREIRGQHRDGSWRVYQVVASNLQDNPAVEGIVVTFRDVTEVKRLEYEKARAEALQQSEERLRHLVDNMNDGFCVIEGSTLVFANATSLKMFGYRSNEVIGKDVGEFLPKEIANQFAKVRAKRATGQSAPQQYEITIEDKMKDSHPVELSVRTVEFEGKPALSVLIRDIAERKRMEDALKRSEEHYRSLIENALDAITIIDESGTVIYESPALARMLGSEPNEKTGGSGFAAVHPDDMADAANAFARLIKDKGSTIHAEVRAQHKDGSWRYLEVTGRNLLDNPAVNGVVANTRDITERKLAEAALREREEHFRALIENSKDGITVLDSAGIIRYESPSVEHIAGYDPDELIGLSIQEFVHPDDLATVTEALKPLVVNPGQSVDVEARIQHKDGSWRNVEATATSLLHDSRINGIVVNFRDVTERRMAGDELRIKSSALDNSIIALAMADMAGNITYLNNACMQMWGGDLEADIIGKPYWHLLWMEDNASVAEQIATSVIETGSWEGEVQAKNKNGEDVSVRVFTGLVRDDRGKPIQTISWFLNVTEGKRAEEALRESERKFRSLVEEMNDGYCVVVGVTVAFANAQCAELFGYARDEIVGKTIQELLPSRVLRDLSMMRQRRKRGEAVPSQYETKVVDKNGHERTVELSTRVITYEGSPGLSIVLRDVTERKKVEQEKANMEEQLQLTARLASVGELAAGVAHELNNPLAAVQAYAQFVSSREGLDEALRSDVQTIYKEAQRASRITANLLSFARKHRPQMACICINDVIEESLELHAYRMNVNNIEVVAHLDPDLPFTMADFHQMQQVFVNLIVNAEQAMTEAHGGGKLTIRTRTISNAIQATFTDTGPGVPPEELTKIFDPFFTTKTVGKGTGLGLSICYGIVQAHKGQLYVRSKLGEGATFVVEVPIVSEHESQDEQVKTAEAT
jgi:PAS domain S-box-containing protein